jgi:hypothetical protein
MGISNKIVEQAFCLLYVPAEDERHTNMRFGGIQPYLYCAYYLWRSLKLAQIDLTIITNDSAFVIRKCPLLKHANIVQLSFALNVPDDVAFRSAHHKLEIIKYIGNTFVGGHFLILDVDVVCTSPPPTDLLKSLTFQNDGCALDISDQVYGAFGKDRVQRDIRSLSGCEPTVWFGGEFLLGTADFFRRLAIEVESIWPVYISKRHSLHHQGDEAILTAALCKLLHSDMRIACLKPGSLITRWWNTKTLHRQEGLFTAMYATFLHLPADKQFIAGCARIGLSPRSFWLIYCFYAAALIPVHFVRASLSRTRVTSNKEIYTPNLFS